MGKHTGFDPGAFAPFGAMFDNYFAAIESLGRGNSPFGNFGLPLDPQTVSAGATAPLKAAARCQLEMFGLVNRRTQAYMRVPTRLAQCRTPQDVINEQMAFWRTASEQYAESSRRIAEAWGQALPWLGKGGISTGATDRDYINFNGTGESGSPEARPEHGSKQRRVA